MTRLEAVAGLTVLSLLAGGIGRKYVQLKRLAEAPDPQRPVQLARERRPVVSVDGVLHAYLMESADVPEAERLGLAGALLTALESPELAAAPVDGEVGERLAKALIEALAASPDESPEGLELRRAPSPSSRDARPGPRARTSS